MEHVDDSSSEEDAEHLLQELCVQLGLPYSPGHHLGPPSTSVAHVVGACGAGPRVGGDRAFSDREADTSDEGVVGNGSSSELFSSGVSIQDSGKETRTFEGLGPGAQPSDGSSVPAASVLTSSADTSASCGHSNYSKHGSSLELFASSGEQEQGAAPGLMNSRKKERLSLHEELDVSNTRTAQEQVATPSYYLGSVLRQVAYWPAVKENHCFLGCKWSPDGSLLLASHQDRWTRLFPLPQDLHKGVARLLHELVPTLTIHHGQPLYDFCWHPESSYLKFATCSKDHPVQLWQAQEGSVCGCYFTYHHHHKHTLLSPHSLAFSPDGDRLYCGLHSCLKTFRTCRAGVAGEMRRVHRGESGAPEFGIVSCIAVSPTHQDLVALGSFSSNVAVCSSSMQETAVHLKAKGGGVTHMLFSPNSTLLYTGSRKSRLVQCWDLRRTSQPLYTMQREATTSQRIYFDLFSGGQYLVSGTSAGKVSGWSLQRQRSALRPCLDFQAGIQPITGCSTHPTLPLLATTAGCWDNSHRCCHDNQLRLWSLLGKDTGAYSELTQQLPAGIG